jgi:predicted ester cyclase
MKTLYKSIIILSIFIFNSCDQTSKKDLNSNNNETYKITMNRLIEDVWNNQNLTILPEVFTEDAEMHLGGLDYNLKGIPVFKKEYMEATFFAFPDIKHGYDMLLIDGNMIAMSFYGEGTHKNEYDGIPATNNVLKYRGMAFFRMEGNRIAEVWTHSNWATQFLKLYN